MLALLILAAAQAFGQGCAMCYTSASGASHDSQMALNRAVLVLLVPAVTLLVGFVGVAFAYRREREE
jgi:hypothetical protein